MLDVTADTPDTIALEAARLLDELGAALGALLKRADALARDAAHQRASLHDLLCDIGLRATPIAGDDSAGIPVDRDRPHTDLESLTMVAAQRDAEARRSDALRGVLRGTIDSVRGLAAQYQDGRSCRPLAETTDLDVLRAMDAAREEERRRLAREVHDGPAHVLAHGIYIVEFAEQAARRSPDRVAEHLADLKRLLRDGIDEIRRFMFDLTPQSLEELGLERTLHRYVDDHNRRFGTRVSLAIGPSLPRLSDAEERTVFRTAQEGLRNARDHAGVDEVTVRLCQEGPHVVLEIDDRGRGFVPGRQVARADGGAGLRGMRERAAVVGADLHVASAPGRGTTLTLRLAPRGGAHDHAGVTADDSGGTVALNPSSLAPMNGHGLDGGPEEPSPGTDAGRSGGEAPR